MLNRGDGPDRRVFHVKVVFADEDHRQLPDRGQVQGLVKRADVGGAVAEEADGHPAVLLVLGRPGRARGDGQMRPDDGVAAHHAVFDAGEVHGTTLAAEKPARASHQLAEDADDRRAAGQRVVVAAIGAERQVVGPHGRGEARRHRFVAGREVDRSLDQVLEKQVVGALLEQPRGELRSVHPKPDFGSDVVVGRIRGCRTRSALLRHARLQFAAPALRAGPGACTLMRGCAHPQSGIAAIGAWGRRLTGGVVRG